VPSQPANVNLRFVPGGITDAKLDGRKRASSLRITEEGIASILAMRLREDLCFE
jgi:hypothetical protein